MNSKIETDSLTVSSATLTYVGKSFQDLIVSMKILQKKHAQNIFIHLRKIELGRDESAFWNNANELNDKVNTITSILWGSISVRSESFMIRMVDRLFTILCERIDFLKTQITIWAVDNPKMIPILIDEVNYLDQLKEICCRCQEKSRYMLTKATN